MSYYGITSSFALFIFVFIAFYSRGWIHFIHDIRIFTGYVLYLWNCTDNLDLFYAYNVLDPWIQQVLKFNPLYHYITFARTIILYDQMPSVKSFIICGASCLITLVIGMIVFKKNQDKFIYYM